MWSDIQTDFFIRNYFNTSPYTLEPSFEQFKMLQYKLLIPKEEMRAQRFDERTHRPSPGKA